MAKTQKPAPKETSPGPQKPPVKFDDWASI